jgi:hypothetical protein
MAASHTFSRRRLMKTRTAFVLLATVLAVVATSARADDKGAPVNAQRLEALKKLAGDWVAVDKDGKPTDKVVSSIRVTSGGSAVQETLFPGTEKEMVTMYHLDGADLVLTHYCMLGNQPRLRAEPGTDVNTIVFKFVSSTNLKSTDDHHMNQATLTLDGKDRFTAEWSSCKDGKPCHNVKLDLVRNQN